MLAQVGDPHWRTFTRSTLKPLQALPFVEAGGPANFDLTPANLALLCASHNGEPMHVQQVDEILAKAGVAWRRLQCGCHVPARYAATVEALDQLGWLDEEQRQALRPWRWERIASVKGATVGARRAVLRLERPS